MSTRHLLNMTMGAFAMLLLAAVGVVFSTSGSRGDEGTRIDLAVQQQVLVQDLTRQAAALTEAEDRDSVASARANLARTVTLFDRNLTALLHGGPATDANGRTVVVTRPRNEMARLALEDGAHLWLETGVPLADLAAGEFSVFSAAGQKAVKGLQDHNVELMQNMGTVANALRMGSHTRASVAGLARWAAAGLTVVLIGVGFFRRRVLAAEAARPADRPRPTDTGHGRAEAATDPAGDRRPRVRPRPAGDPVVYTAPVDFDSVSASVDQMTVDMNTIAGSTDKMRQAIDSVGHALQGMLYSLNEMAQDTAEGHKIVRNANNAASFTAAAAGDLTSSAREMSQVVARVTQLAQKTRQVAAQIDGEAVHTGRTGQAFTSVVAGEVKGLARQTNQATQEIEQTVADILFTARQYEEAIGQIIKNVSAINKVSQNLGQLMLSPPTHVEPGPPQVAAQALAPAVAPAAPAPTAAAAPVPSTEPAPPVAAEDEVAADTDGEPGPADAWDAPVEPTAAADEIPPAPVNDDPVVPETTPDEVAAETAAAIEDAAESDPPQADGGSNDNVFMLGGRSKRPSALNIPATPPPPAEPVAPAADEAAPASDNDANVFMLNKPKAAPPTDPAAADAAAATTPAVFGGPNIYGLELPAVAAADAEPEAETEAEPEAEPKAETEAGPEAETDAEPGADEPRATGSGNLLMLNKPR